jgi:hypothetical protein
VNRSEGRWTPFHHRPSNHRLRLLSQDFICLRQRAFERDLKVPPTIEDGHHNGHLRIFDSCRHAPARMLLPQAEWRSVVTSMPPRISDADRGDPRARLTVTLRRPALRYRDATQGLEALANEAPRRRRAGDRPPQGRPLNGPQLPQGPGRRPHQRRPHRPLVSTSTPS